MPKTARKETVTTADTVVTLGDAVEPEVVPLDAVTADGEVKAAGGMLAPKGQFALGPFIKMFEASRNLEDLSATVSVVPKYFEFGKVGETTRGVFVDFTTIEKKQEDGTLKPIECVRWMSNGALYLNGGTALVNAFHRLQCPAGTPVEIVYEQKRGNCKIYDVRLLS